MFGRDLLADAVAGEFRRLAGRLGVPDRERFAGLATLDYLISVSGGDEALAHDVFTSLLYDHLGRGPKLERCHRPGRPLCGLFVVVTRSVLSDLLRRRREAPYSERFAGTFTDVGLLDFEDRRPRGVDFESLLAHALTDPGVPPDRVRVVVRLARLHREHDRKARDAIKRRKYKAVASSLDLSEIGRRLLALVGDAPADAHAVRRRMNNRGITTDRIREVETVLIGDGRLVRLEGQPGGAKTVLLKPGVPYSDPARRRYAAVLDTLSRGGTFTSLGRELGISRQAATNLAKTARKVLSRT